MVGRDDAARLAAGLIAGDLGPAITECRRSPDVAAMIGRAVTASLAARAADPAPFRRPARDRWPATQPGVRALIGMPGVDEPALARACLADVLSDFEPDAFLEHEIVEWLIEQAGDVVWAAVEDGRARRPGAIHLTESIFGLHGPGAPAHLLRLVAADHRVAADHFRTMRMHAVAPRPHVTRIRWSDQNVWHDDEWAPRFHALADATLPATPDLLMAIAVVDGIRPPPIESSAAQVHCACVYGGAVEDFVVRKVAEHLRAYRSGDDARDCDLVWWEPASEAQRLLLRGLLEVAGPAGARAPLVAAARARGLIDDGLASFLSAPLTHPDWAEGEVPWRVSGVSEPWSIRVPDRRLAVGDLAGEGPALVVDVPADAVTARVVTAVHPLATGSHNAAIDVVVADGDAVTSWRRLDLGPLQKRGGFTPALGTAGVGAVPVYAEIEARDWNDVFYDTCDVPDAVLTFDEGDAGGLLAVSIMAQHAACAVFAGESAAGSLVRLVIDLELLDADPAGAAGPVWQAERMPRPPVDTWITPSWEPRPSDERPDAR